MQQEIEHLDGFAESHVIGQAGAESEFGHEPQPTHAFDLVRSQRGLQIAARLAFRQFIRRTHPLDRLPQPVASDDRRPLRELLGLLVDGRDWGSGEQSHPLDDRQAVGVFLVDHPPMLQRFLQFGAVDFDPSSAQQRQPWFVRHQLIQFLGRKRLAFDRDVDVEIEHSVEPDLGRFAFPQLDLHLGANRTARLPPIRQADDDARRLHPGRLDEEPVSLVRRPGLGREEAPGIEQLRDEWRLGGGAADGFEQQIELLFVALQEGLFQGFGERQMLRLRARGEFVGEGGQKREWPFRIAFVLRQMKRHLADQMGERIDSAKPFGRPRRIGRRVVGGEGGEFPPGSRESFGGEVLQANHRRRGLNELDKLVLWWRRQQPPALARFSLCLAQVA